MEDTVRQIHELWDLTSNSPGHFRCSAFEFRPYPGTPEWHRLLATGKYSPEQLLLYEHIDLTDNGRTRELLDRDEFNFSVNLQFGEAPIAQIRAALSEVMRLQKQRLRGTQVCDHVQRLRMN